LELHKTKIRRTVEERQGNSRSLTPIRRRRGWVREDNGRRGRAQGGMACANLIAMKISRDDVLRVAELAHLELTAEEVELYRGQLDEILSYIGKLEQLDVASVEPMAQVLFDAPDGAHPEVREDTLRPCNVADAILAQSPDAARPFFRVPKVIDR